MIRSMTGFGEASAQIDGVHYLVELRSLNNKYFKAVIRLQEEFQALEAELESELRRRINRGTVTLTATCTDTSEGAAVEINHRALDKYVEQLRKVSAVSSGELAIDVGTLLTLPGVLQPPHDEEQRLRRAREAFKKLTREACQGLLVMRGREGEALLEELRSHRDTIADRLAKIAELAPGVVQTYEKRLRERIDALVTDAGLSIEPGDLVRELAVFAEKTDIAEETVRLRGHIEQFSEMIDGPDEKPIGRTLDFLAQEMLREANTIASKSPDAQISRLIVEVKGSIDRIKEQVQNAE